MAAKCRSDPSAFRDRYQDALRELADAKLKGRALPAKAAVSAPPLVNLMAALKESLAKETRWGSVNSSSALSWSFYTVYLNRADGGLACFDRSQCPPLRHSDVFNSSRSRRTSI